MLKDWVPLQKGCATFFKNCAIFLIPLWVKNRQHWIGLYWNYVIGSYRFCLSDQILLIRYHLGLWVSRSNTIWYDWNWRVSWSDTIKYSYFQCLSRYDRNDPIKIELKNQFDPIQFKCYHPPIRSDIAWSR